jgi:mono/diheme cytochrome c family protein
LSKSLPTRIAVFIVIAAVAFIAWSVIPTATTFDDDDAMPPVDNDLLARGEYLATAGNCATCHTVPGGDVMAGGLPFVTPFGTIYSTNITPDSETGIGDWSFADFANSMRHGVRPDGTNLYPAFPYTSFTKVTDDDLAAIYAYLMSVEAVSRPARDNELGFPFNQRALMKAWKTLFFDEGAFVADDTQSDDWNRGAYLVEALAHCGACHTPRNAFGAEQAGQAYAGGEYLDRVLTGEYRPWSAPNLTSDDRGLGIWSHEDLASYLKTARNNFLESFGPMNEVIMNSTRHLSDGDIDAMATYLKSLPAIPEAAGFLPDERTMGRGRTIYNLHCGTCHLPTGEGDPEMAPRVKRGSLVVQSDNPASMINAILYSPEAPHPPLPEKWRVPMDEFQYTLDDEEVAAVATFMRMSWGNAAGAVTPDQVARQR